VVNDRAVHETDGHETGPARGRHAATRPPGGGRRLRRRWLVAAAITAAFSALLAPPPASTAVQTDDSTTPPPASPAQAISFLSSGAPTGSVTLASAPAHVATAQPVASTLISGLAANGIPNVALNAYRVAAARMDNSMPSCGIDWSLLAGIGRVESNHGRFGGASLQPDGTSTPRIIGPALDGKQFAFIRDTDHGLWDGDTVQDRAVGPMQFIPATWRAYAVSASPTRAPDPFNINDAALAAAHYLCVAGGNLRTSAGQRAAVMAYNHSDSYVNEVLGLAHDYATGIPVADIPLIGNTTGAIPAASGVYGREFFYAPASPGPAIGARDMTPASGPTTGQAARPAASSSRRGSTAPAGGSSSSGQPASSGGTATTATGTTDTGSDAGTAAGSGTGTDTGSGTGSGSGSTPLPIPVPVPVPVPPAPVTTTSPPPLPISTETPLPTTIVPTCVPVPLVRTC
jgi:hypothetical protein